MISIYIPNTTLTYTNKIKIFKNNKVRTHENNKKQYSYSASSSSASEL